jgi:hypothetical protein
MDGTAASEYATESKATATAIEGQRERKWQRDKGGEGLKSSSAKDRGGK